MSNTILGTETFIFRFMGLQDPCDTDTFLTLNIFRRFNLRQSEVVLPCSGSIVWRKKHSTNPTSTVRTIIWSMRQLFQQQCLVLVLWSVHHPSPRLVHHPLSSFAPSASPKPPTSGTWSDTSHTTTQDRDSLVGPVWTVLGPRCPGDWRRRRRRRDSFRQNYHQSWPHLIPQ